MVSIKSPQEIEDMRKSGQILASVLDFIKNNVSAGMSPKKVSEQAQEQLTKLGGKPAFLGFQGYPDIICISVNDQVQHAIPTNKPFVDGDIVNFDFGVEYNGMVTDAGITVCIGELYTDKTKMLLEGTERALYKGIGVVKDGVKVGDVSNAIENELKKYKLGIVRDLVGHGVGHELHEEPEIPNYGHSGTGPVLKSGMTVAIEPITTLGSESIIGDRDGWTLWTEDGSLSAQFEHTILVTDTGCEILTQL